MEEIPTSSSSPQRTLPLQQNPSIIGSSNSQQLQSPSPSLEHKQQLLQSQQQLVQSQQQLVQQQQQQQMAQAQQQMVQPQQFQQQLQQQQNGSSNSNSSNNMIEVSNFHQGLQRNTSLSMLNQMQQNNDVNNQLGLARQQQQQNSGIYTQMNFGGMNTIQQTPQQLNSNVSISNTNNGQQTGQQNQLQQQIGQQGQLCQQIGQQNQLSQAQQQMAQIGSGNLTHSALMGQTGHLPMLSGQAAAAAAQFNLQNQFLTSPRQKAGFMQGSQFHVGNSAGQSLQEMGMMGSLNLSSQLRNGTLPYSQQRMTPSQLRQHLTQQNALTAGQGQNITRTSFMNGQISGLAQNGHPGIMQNALSQQQQWLKQMPAVSSPNSSSLRLQQQQQRQQMLIRQQQLASSQLQSNSLGLNPQQLPELVQQQTQMGHSQQKQQQQQQQAVQQQIFHQQQSPRIVGPGGAKSVSLTGSQPDATVSGATTPGGSSSQGTEASHQLLGKRKIQDLLSQMNLNGIIDPEVEDYLLEFADHFINTVSSFSCTLAKLRKSSTLEAKDVLLHLEKNWNLTVPGFSSEEKKHVRDHPPSDAHKKRLHVIRNLMEPVKSEASTAAKQMVRQGQPTNQVGSNHMIISPSPSSDQLVFQSPIPHMLQQTARF
ncbi:hypothetical protein OROGR_028861 [Orobanche gracilis]